MFHLSLRPLRPLSNGKQSPTYWIQYLHVRTMRQSWALTSRLTWLVRTGPDVSIPNLYANELGIDRWLGPWRACTWFWRIDFFFVRPFCAAIGHSGPHQSAARTESQNGGAAAGAVRHLHAVRAAVAARAAAQGEHVQEQTPARPRPRLHGSKVTRPSLLICMPFHLKKN